MKKLQSRRARITTSVGLVVLFIGIVFFLLRGPYLSNSIKRMIIPALENVTRESVIIDKAVINLFPFYVQAKGFKLFDKEGNRLLWITKSRAYIDLIGLLSNEIRIRKLTLLEPDVTATEKDVARIIENVQHSADIGKEGKFRVVVKNIKITDGTLIYNDSGRRIGITGSGLFLDMISKKSSSTVTVSLKTSTITLPNDAQIDAVVDGRFMLEPDVVEILNANINASGSSLDIRGKLTLSADNVIKGGTLSGKAVMLADTFSKVFDVNTEEEGRVNLEGTVLLLPGEDSNIPRFDVDLRADSHFYLETLMKLLNVNENIRGKVSFKGSISGIYPDVTGSGRAKLEDAVLDTLPINELEGGLYYKNSKLALNGFTAHTLNGTMKGDAHILIPGGDYSVQGELTNIFSPEFFQFIRWKPPLPEGTVNGHFHLFQNHGENIQVAAALDYENGSDPEGDVLNRLRHASASIVLSNNVLTLTDASFATEKSTLLLDGKIDLNNQLMDLDLALKSDDASDLSAPYYENLIAPVTFSGKAEGPLSDPAISGKIVFDGGMIHGFPFAALTADVRYTRSRISTDDLRIEQEQSRYDISGAIDFRQSQQLFSFKSPYFRLKASVSDAPLRQIITVFSKEMPVAGTVNGTAEITGGTGDVACTAHMTVSRGEVYGQPVEYAEIDALAGPEMVNFKNIQLRQGSSLISGSGTLFYDKRYDMKFRSDGISLHDIAAVREFPVDAVFSLNLEGSGSLDRPAGGFSLDVHESSFKGQRAGAGTITGTVSQDALAAEGVLADGRIRGRLHSDFPQVSTWSVDADFADDVYDFLLAGFLKELPENFSVRGKGTVGIRSDKGKLSVRSLFSSFNVNLYGYAFQNSEDINVDLNGREIALRSFAFRGKNSEFSVSGRVTPGDSYDLSVKGNIDIAPLKAVTDKFIYLDGRGSIAATVRGDWKKPEITGEVTLQEASAVLASQSQKIGPVSGELLFRKDRISFDSLSVGFSGGTLLMSGAGHVSNFSLDKLYLSSALNNILIRPVEGVTAEIGGQVFYEFSGRGSILSGNISVDRARYTKKFDWRSWLLGLGPANGASARYPDFIKQTKLNLQISGSDNIVIDNNVVSAPVMVRINVVGTVERFGLVGRVESKEGRVYFRGNEFKIVEGSRMDFLDPDRLYPLFHIVAETYKYDYFVKLSIDGGPDDLIVTFFSDPPLPESDIISLLTFGRTGKDSKSGFGGGIAAGEATAMLTGGIQENIEEELKGITGLERVKFEPHTTSTGAFTSKVTVGKSLLEDRVLVSYSTAIGTTEEQIVRVEYKLSDEVSLVGSRDEFGITGADLKYRIQFR